MKRRFSRVQRRSSNPPLHVFTSQASQEPGMGMEPYSSSPAARDVWDTTDACLLVVYGFSIVEIVKNNPKEKTIHFDVIKKQAIRARFMEMAYDTMDKDGVVRTLPLFGDINVRTQRYTFSHHTSLLFVTQFTQTSLRKRPLLKMCSRKASFRTMLPSRATPRRVLRHGFGSQRSPHLFAPRSRILSRDHHAMCGRA